MPPESEKQERKPSQATRLVELGSTEKVELFHTPTQDAYVTIDHGDRSETWPVKSKSFRAWLRRAFHQQEQGAASSAAMQDALDTLEGKALYEGIERPVHVRLAEHDGRIYLDLANEYWTVIEIAPDGWTIADDPPVRFRRTGTTEALPIPTRGGSIDALRSFVNIGSDADWRVYAAWVINAFRPNGPFPVLVLHGEQGSAKSTTAAVTRKLVDPSKAGLRAEPRSIHDLMIAARNSYIACYDNLSAVSPQLSDAFCRLSTGGGFATRELYTDDAEAVFDAKRPIILNGISELTTRSDLLDRSLLFSLPRIRQDERRTEADFWTHFDKAWPSILGALLDIVAAALRNMPFVELACLPRMADFAEWSVAAEPALGWAPGSFMTAYAGNREQANELALEASAIAEPIRSIAADGFKGTKTELYERLRDLASEEATRAKAWPANAQKMTVQLRRIAPNLRLSGIEIEEYQESAGSRRRMVEVRKGASVASPTPPDASHASPNGVPETGVPSQMSIQRDA